MFGPVVIASDGSPGARRAGARARVLSDEIGLPLVVVYVVEPEEAAADVRRWLPEDDGPFDELVVETGQPASTIVRVASDKGASLVIVGAHGERLERAKGIGAVSDRIVRLADRSVLVVKNRPSQEYMRVVSGIDGSEESLGAARMARVLAPHADLRAVHAFSVVGRIKMLAAGAAESALAALEATYAAAAEMQLRESLDRLAGSDVTPMVAPGRPDEVITRIAQSLDAELVAIGTSGSEVMRRILLGGTRYHLLQALPCDILIHRQSTGPPSLN